MEEYAFTVVYLKTVTDIELGLRYQEIFDKWQKFGVDIKDKVVEYGDELKKMHYHGVIGIKRGLYRKKLMMANYSIKLEAIYNKEGWQRYISKCKKIQQRNMFKVNIEAPTKSFYEVKDATELPVDRPQRTRSPSPEVLTPTYNLFRRTKNADNI